MARIYRWFSASLSQDGLGTENGFEFTIPVLAGNTLERTLIYIDAREYLNVAHFPADMANPVAVGVYQAFNELSSETIPSIGQTDAEWLYYATLDWRAEFGVTSSTQSDLVWLAHAEGDVRGRRHTEITNPTLAIRIGTVGSFFANGCRNRSVGMSFVARQLWSHEA